MIDNALEKHLLLSTSLLEHLLLGYSRNADGGGGSLRETICWPEGLVLGLRNSDRSHSTYGESLRCPTFWPL